MVELAVTRQGKVELRYVLKDARAAADYIEFLSDFWIDAEFVLQPVRH